MGDNVKIRGRIFATFEEVIEEIYIKLNNDDFSIEQLENAIIVTVNGERTCFEKGSLKVV